MTNPFDAYTIYASNVSSRIPVQVQPPPKAPTTRKKKIVQKTNPLLRCVGDRTAYKHREQKLQAMLGYVSANPKSDYLTTEAIVDTFDGTQYAGENHRRHTPIIQAVIADRREFVLDRLDQAARINTTSAISLAKTGHIWDVIIIGSGPHGVSVLSYLREKHPKLKTLLIEANDRLGGQWRSYGDRPVFAMNSRNRRANRRLPTLPRTEGNINTLGTYSPLELSDFVNTLYPMNTDMGVVCAINGWLSASDVIVGKQVTEIYRARTNSGSVVVNGNRIFGKMIVDATGMRMRSVFENTMKNEDKYFTTNSFYKHFASHDKPMELFAGQEVMVIGAGDSALTVLEALIGMLPPESYGASLMGRHKPREILWQGAPQYSPAEIAGCLRTRYKNGIVQSIRRDTNTNGAIGVIRPIARTPVSLIEKQGELFTITSNRRYQAGVVIDCSRLAGETRERSIRWDPSYFVGPGNGAEFSQLIRQTISDLRVPENNTSLWATMPNTETVAEQIGRMLGS